MLITSSQLANRTNIFEIVNFVIMTSSLFMFTFDNIRYEGDTDFVFVVLLSYDKILSNAIKILKKRSIYR